MLYQLSYIGAKSLRYLILLFVVCCLGSNQAQAALVPADGQSSIPVKISQGVEVSVQSDSNTIFQLEYFEDATTIYAYLLPLTSPARLIIVADNPIVAANKQYTWVNGSFQTSDHVIALWKKPPRLIGRGKNSYLPGPTLVPDLPGRYKFFTATLTISSAQLLSSVTAESNANAYPNNSLDLVSLVYEISNPKNLPLIMDIGYTDNSSRGKEIYYLDRTSMQWLQLPTVTDGRGHRAVSYSSQAFLTVAIFTNEASTQGLASWYDQSRYRSFHYQGGNFAASRTLPKGTKVKVTRVKTGKSIVVTINDWGPEEKTGRILDLDKAAYKQLASTGSGEMMINLDVIND
ncbi:MAG: septal ring lytic transglycosylase RlpA family protein [Candidatus Komeilibacteria bacterium]